MHIEMRSQNAYLGIKSDRPIQSIEQPKSELNIHQEQSKVEVESTLPKVQIDQTQAFSESGLKGVLELGLENAKRAMGIMVEKIARIVDEGNQFADIQSGVDAVAENAENNAYSQFDSDLTITTMPMSGPNIEVIEGINDIKVTGGMVETNPVIRKPIVSYQPGKVNIYLEQRNSLTITAVGDKFDRKA